MRRRARELLEQLGHGEDFSVDRRVETLNIGQQQIVEIAKALAWEAKILILDEPTLRSSCRTPSACSAFSGGFESTAARRSTCRIGSMSSSRSATA
ncbi:MAG: ATP-binding cassette domain-containing protein [Actinomycetia bacterium]|nr:ATP-binding cassette domain-containing protein [Actinomycetes bacterium]